MVLTPPQLSEEDIIAMWDCTEPLTNRVVIFARAVEAVTLAAIEARYRKTIDQHTRLGYRDEGDENGG